MKNVLLKNASNKSKNTKKRNLDNSELVKFFGKGPNDIWLRDIHTGESNADFYE